MTPSWRNLRVGEWFYDYEPACLHPHGVMERTENGYVAVCTMTYDNPAAAATAQLIVALKSQALLLTPEAVEGLKVLRDMCEEHLALLAEREEALRLMAPEKPEDWPTFPQETFISVLRNVLQVKVSAQGNSETQGALLDKIAAKVGLGDDWTPDELLAAVKP